jgi:hypothetical protein
MELMSDTELVVYIRQCARRHTKDEEDQKDCRQEAWLAISCAPAGYSIEAYKTLAYKSIRGHYWQLHKEALVADKLKQLSSMQLINEGIDYHDIYKALDIFDVSNSSNVERRPKRRFFLKKKRRAATT